MNYKPLKDRIIIKPLEDEYEGSIIVPDKDKIKPVRGVVMKIGDWVSEEIKEEDEVIFNEYAGDEVVYKDETYLILSESEVLGVVK